MSTGAVFIGLVLLALLGAWVLLPIMRGSLAAQVGGADTEHAPEVQAERQHERQHERLQVYYARALRNLRDLEEDYALGKLDEAAYTADRAYWSDRGVAALKALDALNGTNATQSSEVETAANGDDVIAVPVLFLSNEQNADDATMDIAIEDAIEQAVRRYRERQA